MFMAEPLRLPAILLPWEKSIIYFVTISVKDRRQVLATPEVFDAIEIVITRLQKWNVLAGVIMPDHVHWVVSPVEDRDLSIGDFSHGFKRMLRKCPANSGGSGSVGALIGYCVRTRTSEANGFT